MSNAPRAGIFLALLLLLPMVHGQSCTSVPTNGCDLTQDTTLILGTYFLPNGMDATTDNVRLNCNGATIRGSNVEGEHGVLGVFRTNVTVRNCRFEDYNPPSFGSGVFFAQSHFITVQDSIFEDTAFGISINGTVANDHIVIEDNLFISTRRDNLLLKANFSVARGNTFLLSTEENGLHMDGAHNLIEDNVFDSPNTQLLSFQVKNITVRRNFFRGTGETATAAVLFFPFAGGTFEDVTFVDNRVEDAYVTFGDYFSPGITHSDLTVSRNSFKDVGWVQVDFWDESVVSSNNGTRLVFGIQFAGGRNHLVQGNRLDGPGCADFANAPPPFGTNPTCNRINVIVLSAPVVTEDLTVQHNRMSDAQLGSFVVGDGGPGGLADATILNNTITNSRGGMMIQDGSGLAIEENHVDAEINDMHLTSSTVQSNTFAGDQFNVSGSGSAFIDNTLDGIAVTDTGAGHTWCVGITGNNYINGATYAGNNPGGGSCGSAGDLSVEEVLPIQTVRDVPLIKDKKGVIRTTVRWDSPTVLTALVNLTYTLVPIGPGSPIALGQQTVTVLNTAKKMSLFNFTPVANGAFSIIVRANTTYTESNYGNNENTTSIDVQETSGLKVVYVPVETSTMKLPSFATAVEEHHKFLSLTYPLADGAARLEKRDVYNATSLVIPFLVRGVYTHARRFATSEGGGVVGLFPEGLLSNTGYSFWPAAFGIDRTVLAQDSTQSTTAHEIGHTFKLCDEDSSSVWLRQYTVRLLAGGCPNGDNSPPFGLDASCVLNQGCTLSAIPAIVPWSTPPRLIEETFYRNFMGSANSQEQRWIDSRSYLHLMEELQTPLYRNVSERILISGAIVRNGSDFQVLFEPFEELGAGEILMENRTGNFSMTFLNASGGASFSLNFSPSFVISSQGGEEVETNISPFALITELPPNLTSLRIADASGVLGNQNRSLHRPVVEIVSPLPNVTYQHRIMIHWNASDSDSDSLLFVVGISADGGISWHSLTDPIQGTNMTFDLNDSILEPTSNFLVRVRALDGFLSSEAIMNISFELNPTCSDFDGDSVCARSDNCINGTNTLQEDFDQDSLGDVCDPDDDNDGVPDASDVCHFSVLPEGVPTERLLPLHYADIDGDGFFESIDPKTKSVTENAIPFNRTFGCSCEEILNQKPGEHKGETKYGCMIGTIKVFSGLRGWAK